MSPVDKDTTNLVVRYLGPHGPHGLLAFMDLVIVGSLILSGLMSPPLAVFFGVIIYAMFGFFKAHNDNSQVKLRSLDVEQTREQIRSDALKIGQQILSRASARVVQAPAPPLIEARPEKNKVKDRRS